MSFSRSTARNGKSTGVGKKESAVSTRTTAKPNTSTNKKSASSYTSHPSALFPSLRAALSSTLSDDLEDLNDTATTRAAGSDLDEDVADDDDEDDSLLTDSLDAAWEAEMQSRHSLLDALNAGTNTSTTAATNIHGSSMHSQPYQMQQEIPLVPTTSETTGQPARGDDGISGLDEEEHGSAAFAYAPASFPSAASSASPASSPDLCRVPSLFDLAVEQLGLQYHTICAQEARAQLPPGTLESAMSAVRKAALIDDNHLPLLFRTLPQQEVSSASWLEKDCGITGLLPSSLEGEQIAKDTVERESLPLPDSSSPSLSPSPPATASPPAPSPSPSPTRSPLPASSPTAVLSASPPSSTSNTRSNPLHGTPGVRSSSSTNGCYSMNSATLARLRKQQQKEAAIAAGNLLPSNSKPKVKEVVSSQQSIRSSKRSGGTFLSSLPSSLSFSSSTSASVSLPSSSSAVFSNSPSSDSNDDFLIRTGHQLDLRRQFKVTPQGFRTIAGLMQFTRKLEDEKQSQLEQTTYRNQSPREHEFSEEQKLRLRSVGVSEDLRSSVQTVLNKSHALGSLSSSPSLLPPSCPAMHPSSIPAGLQAAYPSLPPQLLSLATHFHLWRPLNLLSLELAYTNIDSEALILLVKQTPNLLKIDLCGCDKLTPTGISSLPFHCRLLQVVLLEVVACLNDSIVQHLIHSLPHLIALDIGSCRRVTNVSWQIIGSNGKRMKRLSAAGCAQTTVRKRGDTKVPCPDVPWRDFDIEDLSKCVSLLSLSLRACAKITDEAATHLVTLSKRKKKAKMRGLQRLDIGGCVRLSDGSITALCAAYSSSLTHLDLRGLTRLTNRSIDALIAHCYKAKRPVQTLQEINIAACTGITQERIQTLRESWTTLRVIV